MDKRVHIEGSEGSEVLKSHVLLVISDFCCVVCHFHDFSVVYAISVILADRSLVLINSCS